MAPTGISTTHVYERIPIETLLAIPGDILQITSKRVIWAGFLANTKKGFKEADMSSPETELVLKYGARIN